VRITYDGDFKDGKFNGRGKYTYEASEPARGSDDSNGDNGKYLTLLIQTL